MRGMIALNRVCSIGIALGVIVLLAGCGWTPRDEFQASRQVAVHPQAGDGSRVSSGWDAGLMARKANSSTQVGSARGED